MGDRGHGTDGGGRLVDRNADVASGRMGSHHGCAAGGGRPRTPVGAADVAGRADLGEVGDVAAAAPARPTGGQDGDRAEAASGAERSKARLSLKGAGFTVS